MSEHSSAEERSGPHVALSPAMLRSSNALEHLRRSRAAAPADDVNVDVDAPAVEGGGAEVVLTVRELLYALQLPCPPM